MCGILGQVTFKTEVINEELFLNALNLQIHRGPDDLGLYFDEYVALGHRRLSIIDLEPISKQPMISTCGNYILVFNGEIYNYQEIKENLIKKKYKFSTLSDTEVILNAFIEYGIDAIHQFIGMFVFSIYDKVKNEVYIVRDRLGIKPLYYFCNDSKVIFSSEIKSILQLGKIEKKLNMNAVSSYLSFRYPILNDTFFEKIYSLAPAHYMKISNQKIETIEYWNIRHKFQEQQNDKGESYYTEKLREILESSIKYRMIADVPIGSFLSGGVDSSIITAVMAKNSVTPINTFTIGFNDEGFNEFEYAKIVAKKYTTNHHEISLSNKEYIFTMEHLIGYKDAPLSVPNEVPLYLMSQELKKYIKVVLSGEGADEIFGGYGRIFRSPYDYERIQNLDNLNLSEKEKNELVENLAKKYLGQNFATEIEHFLNVYSYTSLSDQKELINQNIDLDSIEKLFIEKFLGYFEEIKDESYSNKLMYVFEKIHLVGLLHRMDVATMASSIEARVPFVDHRLVEFAFTIPFKYKLKWIGEQEKNSSKIFSSDQISEIYDIPKYILKKAYEDLLPHEILYRKKIGFPVPLNNMMGEEFKDYAKTLLLSKRAHKRGIYNIINIQKLFNNNKLINEHAFAMKIWMLVNLELFIKKYFDDKD